LASDYLRIDQLAELLGRSNGHLGAARLAPFVYDGPGMTRSELERTFLAFVKRYGLPQPETNAPVAGYVVDVLFREHRVIVELDGYRWHRSRAKFESDRDRDANTLAAGFSTVRVTDVRLNVTPDAEAERLWKILSGR
jgi:very-short-patch-repair endonuclease